MRQLLLPATAVALVIALALIFFFDEAPSDSSSAQLGVAAAQVQRPLTRAAEPSESPSAPETPLEASATPGSTRIELAQPQSEEEPLAEVIGRVVDESGQALAGFTIELGGVDGVWRKGVQLPVYDYLGWERTGWMTDTDADGRFRFVVPVPTADWVVLYGRRDPLLTQFDRHFGPAGGRDEPRLVRGRNDLGEFVLVPAGAIRGRVTDVDGVPIADADVSSESVHGDSYRDYGYATTGADGRYVLGGLMEGMTMVSVSVEGFIGKAAEQATEVLVGATAVGPDFQLARAQRITGVVVDPAGAPLARVRVDAQSEATQRWGRGGWTSEDGAFVVYVADGGQHVLSAENAWLVPWGGADEPDARVAAGREGLRIVMQWAERTIVRVVDAESGEAIRQFALFGGELSGYRLRDCLRDVESADGTAQLPVTPGPDQRLWVRAPQHVPFAGELAYDDPDADEHVQTVRLTRGASLYGRAVFGGKPAIGVMVEVAPYRFPKDPQVPVDPEDHWGDTWTMDVPDTAAHPRLLSTDERGAFSVSDLAEGTYRVRATSDDVEPFESGPHELSAGAKRYLGELELEKGATLSAKLLLAQGVSPIGLRYQVDSLWGSDNEITRTDGVFEVGGLAAGPHRLRISSDDRRLMQDLERTFEVEAGEVHELVIDLRGQAPGEVVVEWAGSTPPADTEIVLVRVDDSGGRLLGPSPTELPALNAENRTSGPAPSDVTLIVVAQRSQLRIARSESFRVAAGEKLHVVLEPAIGTLTIRLPAGLEMPEKGVLQLRFRADEDPWGPPYCWMHLRGETADWPSAARADLIWDDRVVEIGALAAGDYQLNIVAWSGSERPETLIPEGDHAVLIRAGEATVLEVP